ncbi:MAG: pseudouridine synthase [Chitinophagaceae bacterium]|nr:pseudouridine synthase [Chitinophagaceae bacterium]
MKQEGHRYFVINKPYQMVSQFISSHDVRLLGDLNFSFPDGTHAIGRLDNHSEGLLLLTTNPKVTRLLFQSNIPHSRSYLIQVKNKVSEATLEKLRAGILISGKGGVDYHTKSCNIQFAKKPASLDTPLHEIPAHLPHDWLQIDLTEGKFHQVRKMVAAVHHKCKRLIRTSIESIHLNQMQPGEVIELSETDFFNQLRINYY